MASISGGGGMTAGVTRSWGETRRIWVGCIPSAPPAAPSIPPTRTIHHDLRAERRHLPGAAVVAPVPAPVAPGGRGGFIQGEINSVLARLGRDALRGNAGAHRKELEGAAGIAAWGEAGDFRGTPVLRREEPKRWWGERRRCHGPWREGQEPDPTVKHPAQWPIPTQTLAERRKKYLPRGAETPASSSSSSRIRDSRDPPAPEGSVLS